MLQAQGHRMIWGRPRARTLILVGLAMITAYFLLFSEPGSQLQVVPYLHDKPANTGTTGTEKPLTDSTDGGDSDDFTVDEEEFKIPEKTKQKKPEWELTADEIKDWVDPTDQEDPDDVEKGYETDGKYRSTGDLSKLQREKDMRKEWRHAYKITANLPTSNLIYGNTLSNLEHKEDRSEEHRAYLRDDPNAAVDFSVEKPVRFNPYPDYNSDAWKEKGFAPYVPCKGATGEIVEDLLVFKGRPHDWPAPRFGSYDVLNMDSNLCWERETRLGPYGTLDQFKKTGGESEPISWDNVNWGDLQRKCVHKNAKRYDMNKSRKNDYLSLYPETAEPAKADEKPESSETKDEKTTDEKLKESKTNVDKEEAKEAMKDKRAEGPSLRRHALDDDEFQAVQNRSASGFIPEKRTAILLRSYTGKNYTDNDKQNIRSLVSELSLKSGGEYEVFLLVQVKDNALRIFDDPETYQYVLSENIPPEFQGITVLWNDEIVWNIYTEMKDENERTVHTAQWLSVQKFSHDHPQFDFIWNWEMDFRFTGHHYELLDKLEGFAKKQPRKGMWERNERWYIPEYHGDYDTTFRKDIERRYGNDTVWGAPDLPFINPAGPKPPVSNPFLDNYEWGVGEDADVITVGPIFNPVNSNWVIANHVWGYKDEDHKSKDIPRRTTIVTQSRLSKRLLDMMHVENMRGNHVASEMTPQTVALLHGFKAVYAPHPIFMDRDWDGKFLNKWFNPGENGECGGRGSPMGWGRERRYQGTTWYYRAEPPNRLYNNWMGWPDTGIGGKSWEEKHGRPCLPQVMLHQVKDSVPTKDDHTTGFELAYG
ncbi:Fc.00g100910.m01.CDS01 [Cosmosporella sp. VM-42]